jgi:hypothetical protein
MVGVQDSLVIRSCPRHPHPEIDARAALINGDAKAMFPHGRNLVVSRNEASMLAFAPPNVGPAERRGVLLWKDWACPEDEVFHPEALWGTFVGQEYVMLVGDSSTRVLNLEDDSTVLEWPAPLRRVRTHGSLWGLVSDDGTLTVGQLDDLRLGGTESVHTFANVFDAAFVGTHMVISEWNGCISVVSLEGLATTDLARGFLYWFEERSPEETLIAMPDGSLETVIITPQGQLSEKHRFRPLPPPVNLPEQTPSFSSAYGAGLGYTLQPFEIFPDCPPFTLVTLRK